ncbi:hypothetical protein PR048_006327 [Dryococelus australis]|uniref:Uncharacterized protein n=1 Tax=Dryococelus australis TaxID=614101 RepID=A0ABQ9IAQ9_9NEOP|nr:hypothetical protein PR048_006327 [Dryococelus australis]
MPIDITPTVLTELDSDHLSIIHELKRNRNNFTTNPKRGIQRSTSCVPTRTHSGQQGRIPQSQSQNGTKTKRTLMTIQSWDTSDASDKRNKMWKIMRQLRGTTKRAPTPAIITPDGTIYDPKGKSNAIADSTKTIFPQRNLEKQTLHNIYYTPPATIPKPTKPNRNKLDYGSRNNNNYRISPQKQSPRTRQDKK